MAGLTEVEYQKHLRWEEEQKRKREEERQKWAAETRETKIHGPTPKYTAPADVDPWAWSGMDPKEQKAELVRRKMADPEFQQRMAALGPEKLQAQAQQISRNEAAKKEENILRYRRENPYEAAQDEQLSSGERLTSAVNHHQKRLQDGDYDAKFGAGLDRLGRGAIKRAPGFGLGWSIAQGRDRADITKKISAGEATPDEYLRLGMYIAEEERAAGRTGFAKAADIASYLPGFATEFMLSGGGAAVGRAAVQKGIIKGAEKLSAKGLAVSMGGTAARRLTEGAGFLGAAAGQASHPVMWGRAADTFLKKRDPGFKLKGRKASRGYDVVVNEHSKSIGKHAYEAMWSHYIEIMSERLGAPMMKGLGKASGVGWLASKLPDNHLKRVGADVLKRSGEFAQKTGLSFNPIEEYLEEVAGDKLKSSRFTADEEGHLSGLVGKFLADPLNKAVQTSLWKETGPMLGAFAMSGVAFGAVPSMQYGRSAEIREQMDLREKALQQAAQQQAAGAAEGGDAGYKAFNEARKSRLAQEAGIEALRGEEQELAAEKRREEATPLDIALQGIRKEAVESTAGIYARDELNEFDRTAKGSDTAAYEKAKEALWEKLAVGGEKSLSRKDISTLFEGKEIPPDLRSKHGRDAFLQGVQRLGGLVQALEERGEGVPGAKVLPRAEPVEGVVKEPAPEEPSDTEEFVKGETKQSLEMFRAKNTPPEEYVVDTAVVKARFKRPGGLLRKEASREAAPYIAVGHTVSRDIFKEREKGELFGQTEIYLHQKTGAENPQELLDWYKEKHPELKDVQIGGLEMEGDRGLYLVLQKKGKPTLEGAMIHLTPMAGLVTARHEIEHLLEVHRGHFAPVEQIFKDKGKPARGILAKDMERYEHDDFNRFAYLHRALVRDALREGKEVPEEVLADYPDLAEEYRPGAAQEPSEAPVAEAVPHASPQRVYHASPQKIEGPLRPSPGRMGREATGIYFAYTPEEAVASTPRVPTSGKSLKENVTEWDVDPKNTLNRNDSEFENIWNEVVGKSAKAMKKMAVDSGAYTAEEFDEMFEGEGSDGLEALDSILAEGGDGRILPDTFTKELVKRGYDSIDMPPHDDFQGWFVALDPAIVTRAGEAAPAAPEAAEAKEELTDWKEILRRAKAAGVSAQIPKGETKADLAARVIAAEEAAKEEPPAEEEIEDTPDIEVREIEEEAPKPKKTGVKKTKSQKAAIKRFRGRQSAARTAVEKADAQELEQWEYDNSQKKKSERKKKPSSKSRWWKYSLSRTPTAETETKADVVIGRVELKNKAEWKETRLSLDKIAQLADRVPEFAYNPVFVVEERLTKPRNTYAKDTAPLKLIYRNGVQFIITPALFNLEQKDLAPGMTVGINLEDLFIKRRTEAEVVGKLFRDSPPVARAGQAVRVSSKKNVVSFSHTDRSKRATASRIGKHRWRSDDKELQAKLDSINWVTEGFAAEAKEEAPKPEKPKKGAKKTKPKKKAEPTAAPEAAVEESVVEYEELRKGRGTNWRDTENYTEEEWKDELRKVRHIARMSHFQAGRFSVKGLGVVTVKRQDPRLQSYSTDLFVREKKVLSKLLSEMKTARNKAWDRGKASPAWVDGDVVQLLESILDRPEVNVHLGDFSSFEQMMEDYFGYVPSERSWKKKRTFHRELADNEKKQLDSVWVKLQGKISDLHGDLLENAFMELVMSDIKKAPAAPRAAEEAIHKGDRYVKRGGKWYKEDSERSVKSKKTIKVLEDWVAEIPSRVARHTKTLALSRVGVHLKGKGYKQEVAHRDIYIAPDGTRVELEAKVSRDDPKQITRIVAWETDTLLSVHHPTKEEIQKASAAWSQNAAWEDFAAEPKKGEPAPKEKSQEQLAEEKLMPLAEMKEEQAKLVEKLGTSEATAVRVVHSKDPLAEKYGATFLKVVNNPAVKSIKYAENPDLSGDVAAGMAPLPHGYLVELAPGWITREGRTYVMLDYPASAQRDLALNPRNREPLIHKEGDGEYEVGEGFSDAEEIVNSPSRWKKAVDDFMKWVSGVFTEKQPVTQRAKARASLYRRYFQVGGLLGKEAYTRIQQSRGKIEGDMQVVYQSLGDLNRLLVETGWVTKTWKKPSTKFFDASELLDHNQRFRLSRLSRTKLTEMDSVAKAMDVPKELLPPIKRIREHLNKLSSKVYEMLKKDLGGLEADEDFVKRYGDVLDLAMGQHGIYLTRTFELFDNPERGEKVRKEYPDLYKTFKEEYGKVDRNRRVKKLAREMLRRSHKESKDFFDTLKDRVEERMEEYRTENPDVKKGSERYKRRKKAIRNLFVEEHRRDIKALAELKTQPLKPEELEGHMNILLSPKRAKPALVRESLGRVDMNIFIMRKLGDHRYHQMLRKILGEYYNRFELNMVRTAERLSSIVAQQEAQDFLWEYAKKNKWVALDNKNRKSKQPVGEAHIRVSDSIEFGPFRGAYVTPEFELALKDEFGSGFGHVKPLQGFLNYTVFKIWGRMMGSARFSKTLLSSTVQVRNWAANGSISFVNGHMWSMNKTLGENFRAFYMSGKATLETHFPGGKDRGEEKIDNQTIREHIKELMDNGVVFDSPSNDLADMIRAAWDKPIMSILHDGPNLESASSIEKAVRTAKRGVVRVLRGSAGFYRFGDDFWKVLGYSSELAVLREAFPDSASVMKVAGKPGYPAFEGDMKLDKNRDKWIKTVAANRIRDMYPTFGNAANWVKAIRWFPLVGTFPTYFAELVRTQYIDFWKIANRDLRSGIPVLRSRAIWRVTRWASANFATGFVAKHALRALVAMMPGISAVGGDDEEELRDLLAPWSKNSTIFAWKNDKTGEVFTIDLSYVLPYGRLTDAGRALYSGDTVGAKLGGATMEGMGDIFTEDMVFTLLSEAWSGETLEGRKVFDKNDPARDRWVRSLLHAWGAWEPGLVNTSVRTVMGMSDVPSFTGRKYSPLIELIAAMTGQRITKVEVARSFGFKVSEFSNVLRTDKRLLEKVARSEFKPILGFISGSVNQVEKRLPIMERQRKRHFGQMHNYVSTARSLGVSDREITQILKRNGLNLELISAVKSGNYIPYEPSDNMTKQIIGSYNGREKLVKIREHRRKMWVEERERRASGKPLLGARPND